jgi:hypothetical protein
MFDGLFSRLFCLSCLATNLIPTDELKSINGQNRSETNNHETNNDNRVEQLRKKAQELSDYEF